MTALVDNYGDMHGMVPGDTLCVRQLTDCGTTVYRVMLVSKTRDLVQVLSKNFHSRSEAAGVRDAYIRDISAGKAVSEYPGSPPASKRELLLEGGRGA